MTVAVVAVGSAALNSLDTSITITTPAGSSGDLVIFFMIHDDYSDGAFTPSAPPIALTTIHDGSPQRGDDTRQASFWGIEDQAAGRDFTFTYATAEGNTGVCIRFSGHDASTPIQSSSVESDIGPWLGSTDADRYGDMFVGMIGSDWFLTTPSAPTGWTERFNDGNTSSNLYIATKPANKYPFPEQLSDLGVDHSSTEQGGYRNVTFVIAQDTGVSYTLSGVTKDKDGNTKGSCEVALFKADGSSPPNYEFVESTTSDGSGNYSFTVYENPAQFMVFSIKDDTPHVFDATDNVLQPS